ncbi:MAG: thiamine-monophosphate kinase [Candidatus Aminicenantes bacterium]|nr:MAG: thiamine-monophosphate kinase [Candidatus Aminicenantes bacterium]
MMKEIIENMKIEKIARNFTKSPQKVGELHETDAEIVKWGEEGSSYLAVTTDALVEEVTSGLYDDPYFIGWMLAMVNFSDLAAVGADPVGLLLSIAYSPSENDEFLDKLANGISDACKRLNTYVLGGDTNHGDKLFLSGCAVGTVPKERLLTRKGAKLGDRLYLTRPAGLGNVFAFAKLSNQEMDLITSLYRPVARTKEAKIIRKYANCCMDTSDGVIHTLDTLMRINQNLFVVHDEWESMLHPVALQLVISHGLPPWLVLAGVHGEFELCFAISPLEEKGFLTEAARIGWGPVLIGEIREGRGVSIRKGKELIPLDSARIRNLSEEAGSNPLFYVSKLIEIASNFEV